MKKIILAFILTFSSFASEKDWDVSYSQLMKLLSNGKFETVVEEKYSKLLLNLSRNNGRDENTKKLWDYMLKNKRKLNPSYHVNMEYTHRLQTQKWRYDVNFDLATNRCVLKAQSKVEIMKIDSCTEQFYKCVGSKIYNKTPEGQKLAKSCYSKINACHFKARPDFKNLDSKSCSRLYGVIN